MPGHRVSKPRQNVTSTGATRLLSLVAVVIAVCALTAVFRGPSTVVATSAEGASLSLDSSGSHAQGSGRARPWWSGKSRSKASRTQASSSSASRPSASPSVAAPAAPPPATPTVPVAPSPSAGQQKQTTTSKPSSAAVPPRAGASSSSPATASTPAAPAAGGATSQSTLQIAQRSSLSWHSGVYLPGSSPATYQSFATWRGQALDVAVDWPARSTWDDVVNPSWLYDRWKNTPYTKVFGVAPVPEDDDSATMAGCASGAYDSKWKQFGTNIAAAGLASTTIIRLGWEFNGDWYKWAATDPTTFVNCWRHVVTAAESTAPALRWDWTVNRGTSQALSDPRAAYPGDQYVDVVGVDSYDMWPGVLTEADWQKHYSGAWGLKFWSDFAQQHGKPVSVPEWGVIPGTSNAGGNGGDNPFYVQKMVEWFRSLGSHLAYEAYYDDPGSYCASSIFSPVQNPKASAAYQQQYGKV